MAELTPSAPDAMGLDPERWDFALRQIQGWCDAGHVPGAALLVSRHGRYIGPQFFGRQQPDAEPALRSDAIFLVASITKPIVAMAAVRLAEQGEILLDERVEKYVPEFGRNGKHAVTLRNLLTHTSGLPDMLPNNRSLRAANAPLSEFVREACEVGLDFPPGRGVQYQSSGFAMLSEVLRRVTGQPCAQLVHEAFFEPLGMTDTALGAPDAWFSGTAPMVERIAGIRIPDSENQEAHWNWNSRYWRQLGAPWGGLLTTPMDLAKFARMMLREGASTGSRVLSPPAVRAATRNQLEALKDLSLDDRRCRPWGLGWRLNWPAHSANFGEFLGPRAYGHWGATGTALWIDPDLDAFCVFLTTQPQEPAGTYLARASNLVLAAFT
jgi:CubicO group peptidase (beta-lactamase class C family)